MTRGTDAYGPGETRAVSTGSDSPVLFLASRNGHGLASARQAHAWFSQVLVDVGLLGGPDGHFEGSCHVDERSIRMVRWPHLPLMIGDLADPGGATRTVVAKTYRDDRGATTLTSLRRLGAAGLDRGAFRVTAPLGWSRRLRVLVTASAPGDAWSDFFVHGGPRLEIASAAVGGWLTTLQSLADAPESVRLPNREEFRSEADMLREATRVGRQYPWYSRRLTEIARAAAETSAATAAREPGLVPSHGDLHPHNVHLELARGHVVATALDLDTAGLRRPSYDIGYAVAQLLVMSYIRCRSFIPGAIAAEVFRSTVDDGAGPRRADEAAVAAQVCRALVQSLHYELVTYGNGREDLLPAWCGVAEEALSGGVPALLARLLRGWRP